MSKKTITVEECIPKTGKSGKPFHKLNGKYFIWEKDIGRKLEDNVGKTFDLEVQEGDFPKVKEIYDEAAPIDTTPQKVDGKEVVKEEVKNDEVILKKEKPNSAEFGKAGSRVKLYFDDAVDLEKQIVELESKGLFPENEQEIPKINQRNQ
jgi:hypothetical protein